MKPIHSLSYIVTSLKPVIWGTHAYKENSDDAKKTMKKKKKNKSEDEKKETPNKNRKKKWFVQDTDGEQ